MKNLTKRHQRIVDALKTLGGRATQKQIAERADLHPNGVSQSLNCPGMEDVVRCVEQKWGSASVWEIIPQEEKKHPEIQLGLFGEKVDA